MNSDHTDTLPPKCPKPKNLIAAIALTYAALIYMIGLSLFTRFPTMNEDQRITFVVTYGITLCVCYYVTSFMLQGNILARKIALLIAGAALIFTVVNLFIAHGININLGISVVVNLTIIILLRSTPVSTWFECGKPPTAN